MTECIYAEKTNVYRFHSAFPVKWNRYKESRNYNNYNMQRFVCENVLERVFLEKLFCPIKIARFLRGGRRENFFDLVF